MSKDTDREPKMTEYIISALNFFDNNLKIEKITASGWKQALSKHSEFKKEGQEIGDVSWLSDDIEEAKVEAFNADIVFDVLEL